MPYENKQAHMGDQSLITTVHNANFRLLFFGHTNSMWDLSPPIRDQTCVHCSRSADS